jgi:hypothetical protein
VKRTTSLNQTHINRLVNGVCFLTITEASHRAAKTSLIEHYKILVQWLKKSPISESQSLATDAMTGLASIDIHIAIDNINSKYDSKILDKT